MARTETHGSAPFSLDADHALALASLVIGAAALVLLSVSHVAAAWAGLVGVVIAGWSQLISRTRPERFENIIGLGMSAVALAVALARGGLI